MHRAPAAAEHVVQFYDNDTAVCRPLADVVADSVGRRERVVALASAAHWSSVPALLAVRHVDLDRAGAGIICHGSAIVVDQGASFTVRLPALKKTSGVCLRNT